MSRPGALAAPALRWFHTAAAALLVALALVGFQQFYLHGKAYPDRPIPPPIRTAVVLHAVTMSVWMLLYLTQPLLIALRQHRLHMRLGKISVALALVILLSGLQVAIGSAQAAPAEARIWGLPPRQFMVVPFFSVWLFVVYVAMGLWQRRRPAVHRALMSMAMLSVISAGVSRIDALNALYAGTVWERLLGPFFMSLVVGLALVVLKSVLARKVDRWFAGALATLLLANFLILRIAPTAAWHSFSGWLLS